VDPLECVDQFGADAVRCYLLGAVSPFEDGDFALGRLRELYNVELANGLGNLVSRLTALCARLGPVSFTAGERPAPPAAYSQSFRAYEFGRALRSLWELVDGLNRDIERVRPWENSGSRRENVTASVHRWLAELHRIAFWLSPFLPDTSRRIAAMITRDPVVHCEPLFPRRWCLEQQDLGVPRPLSH
jgi:methionyl-tRNA synthetase